MKISVLGAGGWGTTLAILLHYNGQMLLSGNTNLYTLEQFEKQD